MNKIIFIAYTLMGLFAGIAGLFLTSATYAANTTTGNTFEAGDMGTYTIVSAADGGTEVILGPPFKFDPSNIEEWKDIY